jgi:uncharacterized protein (DUF952 family)
VIPDVRPTYHLTPAEWWAAADPALPLASPSLASEGFIHCTDGAAEMVATANRHYADDRREFVVLTVDLERVASPWTVDDPGRIYPHIHGPIDRGAIVNVVPAPRDEGGAFLPFEA